MGCARYINYSIFVVIIGISTSSVIAKTLKEICPAYKKGPSINVTNLIGNWMTVFTQPEAIDCFTVHIRATTEMEREMYFTKYSNFSSSVDWSQCFLQVGTPIGKHFLQGNGTESGLMKNIIIFEDTPGIFNETLFSHKRVRISQLNRHNYCPHKYRGVHFVPGQDNDRINIRARPQEKLLGEYQLQNATADQWTVYGHRGSEVLITRDCSGETAAAFARAHYWPNFNELSTMFHRSGIAIHTNKNTLCRPKATCNKKCVQTPRFNRKGSLQKLNKYQAP